jgi:hypothetical protein
MWFQVDECKGKIAPWMRPVRSLDATEVRSVCRCQNEEYVDEASIGCSK